MRLPTAVAFLFGASLSLHGQILPDAFPVNSHTESDQTAARAAMAPDGGFVVTWYSKEDPKQTRVWARRFDAEGAPLAEEFQVSQSPVGNQLSPAIAGFGAGDFVIVWESTFQDGSQSGIYGRRYVGGVPTGAEFPINTSETEGNQRTPAVAAAPDGRFVVVWETDHIDVTAADIVGQLYDSAGSPVGSQFPVNDETADYQVEPAVAMDADGSFVVTWQGAPVDPPTLDNVFARRFASDGTPQDLQFRVNSTVDFEQTRPAVATDGTGRWLAVWNHETETPPSYEVRGRYFRGAVPEGPDFAVSGRFNNESLLGVSMASGRALVTWTADTDAQVVRLDALGRPGYAFPAAPCCQFSTATSIADNAQGRFVAVWLELFLFSPSSIDIFGRIGGAPNALAATVDPPATFGIPFNGILESGEEAVFAPTYANSSGTSLPLNGSLVATLAPPGSNIAVADGTADYGTLAPAAAADCSAATGDCYRVDVSRGPNLPYGHWDAPFVETLSNGATKTWSLHVGETFLDVSPSALYYPFIEAVAHNGVTVGCGNGADYCSDDSVSRAEMAVFLLKSRYGAVHAPPPATGTVFDDVHPGDFAADWIEELAALGITAGCSGTAYCPNDPVTREQMAVFLLKTLDGSGYAPPDPIGVFGDEPADDPFAPWIEDLAVRQITGGCQSDPLLYCPLRSTSRGEMAVFLTKTFSLVLYGP